MGSIKMEWERVTTGGSAHANSSPISQVFLILKFYLETEELYLPLRLPSSSEQFLSKRNAREGI